MSAGSVLQSFCPTNRTVSVPNLIVLTYVKHMFQPSLSSYAVYFLLFPRSGANISATSDDALWTPGHLAASNGKLECLQFLIEMGIDLEAKGGPYHASTMLHEAAHMGHTDCVKLLLASGM